MSAYVVGLTPLQVSLVFDRLGIETSHIVMPIKGSRAAHYRGYQKYGPHINCPDFNDTMDRYPITEIVKLVATRRSRMRSTTPTGRTSVKLSLTAYHVLAQTLYAEGAVGLDLLEAKTTKGKFALAEAILADRTVDLLPFSPRMNLKKRAVYEYETYGLTNLGARWTIENEVDYMPWEDEPDEEPEHLDNSEHQPDEEIKKDAFGRPILPPPPFNPNEIFADYRNSTIADQREALQSTSTDEDKGQYAVYTDLRMGEDIPLRIGYRCYELDLPNQRNGEDNSVTETNQFLKGQFGQGWVVADYSALCKVAPGHTESTPQPRRSLYHPNYNTVIHMHSTSTDNLLFPIADFVEKRGRVLENMRDDDPAIPEEVKEITDDDGLTLSQRQHKTCIKHLIQQTCQCGIYAFKQPNLNRDYGYLTSNETFGLARVLLYGAVYDHSVGYRASNALIDHMWIVDINNGKGNGIIPRAYASALGESYGISTSIVNNEDWMKDAQEVVQREIVNSTNKPDEVPEWLKM
jgi:hypothetical protein